MRGSKDALLKAPGGVWAGEHIGSAYTAAWVTTMKGDDVLHTRMHASTGTHRIYTGIAASIPCMHTYIQPHLPLRYLMVSQQTTLSLPLDGAYGKTTMWPGPNGSSADQNLT